MVQNTHRSSVVYYWTISSSNFRSPKALRDDKTWSLRNFLYKVDHRVLDLGTHALIIIVSMEK